jgi:hypothetical protein
MIMPRGLSGRDVAHKAKDLKPGIKVLLKPQGFLRAMECGNEPGLQAPRILWIGKSHGAAAVGTLRGCYIQRLGRRV